MVRGGHFNEIARLPVLSRTREQELAARFKEGDAAAGRALVEGNLRFVLKLAHRYLGSGVELTDLVQAGNIGLLEATRRFDPARGCRLITYAQFWIRASMRTLTRRNEALWDDTTDEQELPALEPLPDESTDRAERRQLVRRCLRRAEPLLDERERLVLERRLLASDPRTLRELGAQLGISSERVRQVEERLLEWLAMLLREQGLDGA